MDQETRIRTPYLRRVAPLPAEIRELIKIEEDGGRDLLLGERLRIQRAVRRCMLEIRTARSDYEARLAAARRQRRKAILSQADPPTAAELRTA